MKSLARAISLIKDERGAVLIFFVIFVPVAVGVTALAVDVGHLYGVRNELHNAADAGSLAGAAVLLFDDGSINADADDEGEEAASSNSSGLELLTEVTGQIGHWCFSCNDGDGEFTPIADGDLAPTTLIGVSDLSLDTDQTFVNAVRMEARRSDTPSFFARIFGFDQFFVKAQSVSYIGFAGSSTPGDLDLPIAICERSILLDGNYSCNVGRAISSSTTSSSGYNTGGWTDFDQVSCNGSSQQEVLPYAECPRSVDIPAVTGGDYMNTNGGQVTSLWTALYDFWINCAQYDSDGDGEEDHSLDTDGDGLPDQLWNVTLPVISCDGSNPGCSEVVAFVNMTITWIRIANNGPYPTKMADFNCSVPGDEATCWDEFITAFNLRDYDPANPDTPQPAIQPPEPQDKIIYFLPSCDPVGAFGLTGGRNFGIRAKIPVIVD